MGRQIKAPSRGNAPGAASCTPDTLTVGRSREIVPKAFHGVNAGRICRGCGAAFQPVRRDQRHCRPGCRVLALRKRQASCVLDLLANGVAAGHVEPDVMPDTACTSIPEPAGDNDVVAR
jgi:hypothetical protein